MSVRLLHGDCLKLLPTLPRESFDACVCDPPYHLTSIVKRFGGESAAPAKFGSDGVFARSSAGFMGQQWDGGDIAMRPETWAAVYDTLKPGAHLAAFGGTRTFHRMAVAIEDAGFEIRDCLMWVYGTGFPKSHDVSKGIDKAAGAERQVLSTGQPVKRMIPGADQNDTGSWIKEDGRVYVPQETAPATPEAAEWEGWGTALKPGWEPILLARKPLIGTVVQNVLTHRTGAINIDACRVATTDSLGGGAEKRVAVEGKHEGWSRPWMHDTEAVEAHAERVRANVEKAEALGRWPANVLHDGSDEVLEAFAVYGERGASAPVRGDEPSDVTKNTYGKFKGRTPGTFFSDTGTAARFFYCAKATKADRAGSTHPTVKPIALMRWLSRLVTPPGGLILDPFAGSGTTGAAAQMEGFNAVLIEQSADYVADIKRRFSSLAA